MLCAPQPGLCAARVAHLQRPWPRCQRHRPCRQCQRQQLGPSFAPAASAPSAAAVSVAAPSPPSALGSSPARASAAVAPGSAEAGFGRITNNAGAVPSSHTSHVSPVSVYGSEPLACASRCGCCIEVMSASTDHSLQWITFKRSGSMLPVRSEWVLCIGRVDNADVLAHGSEVRGGRHSVVRLRGLRRSGGVRCGAASADICWPKPAGRGVSLSARLAARALARRCSRSCSTLVCKEARRHVAMGILFIVAWLLWAAATWWPCTCARHSAHCAAGRALVATDRCRGRVFLADSEQAPEGNNGVPEGYCGGAAEGCDQPASGTRAQCLDLQSKGTEHDQAMQA